VYVIYYDIVEGAAKNYTPKNFWQYFPNDWEYLNKILHAYIVFISMPNPSSTTELWSSGKNKKHRLN